MTFNFLSRLLLRPRLHIDLEVSRHRLGDRGEIVHAGVASARQHAVKAFRRDTRNRGKFLEAERAVHDVAQHQARDFRLAAEKDGRRFRQRAARESGVAADALHDGLACVLGQHGFPV